MGYWIVVVDDEPLSLTNARSILIKNEMKVSCLRSGADLLKFVETNDPDLILLDILMPEMDGFETFHALRRLEEKEGRIPTPVIFLTGENNSESERRGLKAGASDFIRKPFDRDILINRINNTIINSKTIESLTEEANTDRLTGFYNKAGGTDRIEKLCAEKSGALMVCDLDSFKLVNDLFGHDMGDRILVAFAEVVRHNVRAGDVFARIGGDEFMGFFPDLMGEAAVASLNERLNEQLREEADKLMGTNNGVPLGISIGVVFTSDKMKDYNTMFRLADNELYRVKQSGKHDYAIYDPDVIEEVQTESLERDMERVSMIISERGLGNGAMLLGQDAFACNYRFIVRFARRYGGVVNKVLFSLSADENDVSYSEVAAEFAILLQEHLRKSDIIYQCKPNQFFAVLPLLHEEGVFEIADRILEKWKSSSYAAKVKVDNVFETIKYEGETSPDERKD